MIERVKSKGAPEIVCVGNFSALPRKGYRLGLPQQGEYRLLINTGDKEYSGKNKKVVDTLIAENVAANGQEYSAVIDLPGFTTAWFELKQS